MSNYTTDGWLDADQNKPPLIGVKGVEAQHIFMSINVLCLLRNGDLAIGCYLWRESPYRGLGDRGGVWLDDNDNVLDVVLFHSLPALPDRFPG
jgi:hypothetical protein